MRKLRTASLADALKEMKVGETCVAPDGHAPGYVKRQCAELNSKGYIFRTSTGTGKQTITRLK